MQPSRGPLQASGRRAPHQRRQGRGPDRRSGGRNGRAGRRARSTGSTWPGSVQRLRLAWSHLGAIDRKDKKRLDQAFTTRSM
ncbi:hypothetical protein LP419_34200 [Massilia sp. H-1]|nr:hypothetical protein LP419_34200 [Massilia sp. H-1]